MTTLILLVVSVLLAGIVTYYATNITMTRTRQEEVQLIYLHCWVDSDGEASAAFKIKNVGSKDILLDEIAVRGVESDWNKIYFNDTTVSDTGLSWINMTDTAELGKFEVNATQDVPLESSGEMAVYLKDPPNIELSDIGTTVSICVYTMNGQWIEEVNVEYAGQ